MLKKGLKQKFIVYLIPLVVFISLAFLAFFLNRANALIKQQLSQVGFSLVKSLSYSSELGVVSEDAGFLMPYLEKVFQEENVVLVAVYNKTGKVLLARQKAAIEQGLSVELMDTITGQGKVIKVRSYTKQGQEFYDFYAPVFIGEIVTLQEGAKELGGFARVGLSLESISYQTNMILVVGLSMTFLLCILGFLLSFFIASRLVKPIRELEEGTRAFAEGNLDYRIQIKTGDEIEDLGNSFNKMAQALGQSRKALEESRRALLNILEDVEREKERAENEKDRTEAILRNFADGLLLVEDNMVALINPQAKAFLSVEEKEIVGKELFGLAKHEKMQGLVQLLQKKGMSFAREELLVNSNLVLEVSTTPVLREGEEIGTMVILHDVTREKAIERMKTEFVSIAAHQLRTPLSAVKWILRMMLDGDLGEIPENQREFLGKTYQSNERMIKLVNDLLNVTRIEEGRFLYSVKPENILQVIEKTIAPLREMARQRGLKFEYKKPEAKIPKISIDAQNISLVIQNLVENAICYTKVGGIKVAVEFLKDKDSVLFSVEDTGIGIPKDQQERVFSRFFRSSTAMKTETEGTGLGLFIARNIIEAHGGKIWFKSTESKGSTFFFSLPVGRREEFEKFIEGF